MYRNWRRLIKPKGISFSEKEVTPTYGKFVATPLEHGFGITLGNSLRRILLSSLQGAAVAAIKIDGVAHEFATIQGVSEDITDIILNIKQIRLQLLEGDSDVMHIDLKGSKEVKEVKAGDIQTSAKAKILNPDLHIATLGPNAKLKMDLYVRTGKGYIPADENKRETDPVGVIAIDSVYAPVLRCNYMVTNARVGQRTDFDKLTLELWTDGSVEPQAAVAVAAKILKDQLQVFINFPEAELDAIKDEEKRDDLAMPSINANLYRRVDELELSVRSANCLQNANIKYIGELCQKSETEMLKTKNFGRKSLNEIKSVLTGMGLSLGMQLDGFDSSDAEKFRPKDVE